MRKIVFIAGLIIFMANAVYAQGVAEDRVIKKIAELNKAGIDTIMVWQYFYPINTNPDTSSCYVYRNPRYLFWVHHNHNFIVFVDECYNYNILKDKSGTVANLLAQHLPDMMQEYIKPPTTSIIYKGKERLSEVTTSDDAWFRYTFYVKGHSVSKSFSDSDLTTQDFDGNKNIYYDQNQRTYLKQLHDIVMNTWPKLKSKKK
jgi:hypothetical protein